MTGSPGAAETGWSIAGSDGSVAGPLARAEQAASFPFRLDTTAPANSTADNVDMRRSQATNPQDALAYAKEIARKLLKEQLRLTNVTLPPEGSKEEEAALTKIAKKWGLRTGFAKVEGKDVETNHLTMSFPSKIYVYEIEMIRDFDQNGNPNRVAKQADKLLALEVMRRQPLASGRPAALHFRLGSAVLTNTWVSDGDLIWSLRPLFDDQNWQAVPAGLLAQTNAPLRYTNEMGRLLDLEQIHIRPKCVLDLSRRVGELFFDTTASSWDNSTPGILTRGLNAFFTAYVRDRPDELTPAGLNKSFRNVQGHHLDRFNDRQTLRALNGFFLSVRPGVQNMYLNISTATSPFFENILVSDFIARMQAARPPRDLGEILRVLAGTKVRIEYNVNRTAQVFPTAASRIRFIKTLIHQPVAHGPANPAQASAVPMSPSLYSLNGRAATVQDFYAKASAYSGFPEYPRPPHPVGPQVYVANVGKDPIKFPGEDHWLPTTALRIVQWTPFRGGRLDSNQTSEMIRVALQPPEEQRATILSHTPPTGGLAHFGFAGQVAGNTQAGLNAFGMRAGTELLRVPARWVAPPTVAYQASRKTPERAQWNMAGVRFVQRPAQLITKIAFFNLSGGNVDHNARQHLARALSRHGIGPPEPRQNHRGPPPPPSINTDTCVDAWLQPNAVGQYQHTPQFEQTLSNKLQGIAHAGFPVVVVLDRKSYDMYSAIKRVAEIRLGIKTICVTTAALYRADRSGHLDLQTSSNIALKFNLKSAGICHEVQHDDLALLKPGGQCNTIVISADVAHSTATAAPGCPSIASVVGSTDARFMHFPGSMRLQRNRKEDIVDLAEMVKERLLDWAAKNGGRRLPQNMLFYRDGVSESQYDIIRRRELPAIQLGINRAHNVLNNNRQAPADVPDTFSPPPEQKRSGKREVDVDDFNLQLKRWEEERADLIEKLLNNVPMNVTFVVVGKRHNVLLLDHRGAVDPPQSAEREPKRQARPRGRPSHYPSLQHGLLPAVPQRHQGHRAVCALRRRAERHGPRRRAAPEHHPLLLLLVRQSHQGRVLLRAGLLRRPPLRLRPRLPAPLAPGQAGLPGEPRPTGARDVGAVLRLREDRDSLERLLAPVRSGHAPPATEVWAGPPEPVECRAGRHHVLPLSGFSALARPVTRAAVQASPLLAIRVMRR